MKVRFTKRAREDLLDIWRHVGVRDARTADRVLERITAACRILVDHPKIGPARPAIGAGARILITDRWLALYRLTADGVQIVRVVDGARDLGRIRWPKV